MARTAYIYDDIKAGQRAQHLKRVLDFTSRWGTGGLSLRDFTARTEQAAAFGLALKAKFEMEAQSGI